MTPGFSVARERALAFRNECYVKDLGFTVSASMFVWRAVFDAVGGFKNGVPEDKDWGEKGAAAQLSRPVRAEVDRRSPRPANDAGTEAATWRFLTLEPCEGFAARTATEPPASCCVGRAALFAGRAARAFVALGSRRVSGNSQPLRGGRRAGADPGLSVRDRAQNRPGHV